MNNAKKLLLAFLGKAKSLNKNVDLIKVLKTNTYNIGKANVLVRTASDLGKRYFFGLNYINAEEINNLDNSFVVFVCGNLDRIVFLPSSLLMENLHQISHDRNGEYKINFTRDLNLVLKGRNNQLDCSEFVNNWELIEQSTFLKKSFINPVESFHSIIQGRLLEVGKLRGFQTYCPDKSKKFNSKKLAEIATLKNCPKLQYSDFGLLRNIDTLWFRKTNGDLYPEYAFEVEFTTGVWSGFGRLATLREYNTKLIIVTHDAKKYNQVRNTFPEIKERYVWINPEQVGLLYSAQRNLISMSQEIGL